MLPTLPYRWFRDKRGVSHQRHKQELNVSCQQYNRRLSSRWTTLTNNGGLRQALACCPPQTIEVSRIPYKGTALPSWCRECLRGRKTRPNQVAAEGLRIALSPAGQTWTDSNFVFLHSYAQSSETTLVWLTQQESASWSQQPPPDFCFSTFYLEGCWPQRVYKVSCQER